MSIEQYMNVWRTIDPETMQWVYQVQTSAFTDLLKTTRKHHTFVRGTYRPLYNDKNAHDGEARPWQTDWRHLSLAAHTSWVPDKVKEQLDDEVERWEAQWRDRTSSWHRFLSDVLVTAVEGGIDYWADEFGARYGNQGYDDMPILAHVREDQSESMGCYGHGARRTDNCDAHTIDFDVLERGIALMSVVSPLNFTSHNIQSAVNENDAGDIDSDGADLIVQFGLFGEIVYG